MTIWISVIMDFTTLGRKHGRTLKTHLLSITIGFVIIFVKLQKLVAQLLVYQYVVSSAAFWFLFLWVSLYLVAKRSYLWTPGYLCCRVRHQNSLSHRYSYVLLIQMVNTVHQVRYSFEFSFNSYLLVVFKPVYEAIYIEDYVTGVCTCI
jgi:hypothetical protein